jgi:hypothetical protein
MFELKKQVLLKSYQGARGKSDDAKPKAVFVLEAENVPSKTVCSLFGIQDPAELTDAFFKPLASDGKGVRDKRFPAMPYVPSSYFSEGHHEISFGNRRPDRVSWLGAMKCIPRMDGKFDVTFRATIDDPAAGICDYLNRNINKSVAIDLSCDPGFQFQYKGSSQAPVDKKDGQADLPLPDPKAAAQLQQAADGLAKPAKKESAPRKAPKPGAKKRPMKRGMSIKKAAAKA